MPVAGNSPLQRAPCPLGLVKSVHKQSRGALWPRPRVLRWQGAITQEEPKAHTCNAPIPSDAHCSICFERLEPGTKIRLYNALACRCDGRRNRAHEECFPNGAIVECDQCGNLKREIRPPPRTRTMCDLCTEMDDPDYPLRQYPDHRCRCYPKRGWIHERCHERSKTVTCSLCKKPYLIQYLKTEAAFESDLNKKLGIHR